MAQAGGLRAGCSQGDAAQLAEVSREKHLIFLTKWQTFMAKPLV